MSLATGNIVRATFRQEFDVQECLNVFYFQMSVDWAGEGAIASLGQALWEKYETNWRGIASTAVVFDRVIIENLDGTLDYGEYVIPVVDQLGTVTGTPMAGFAAYAIQLNRTSRLVRHGSKRLVGVSETQVENYGILIPDMFNTLQDLADDFASDVEIGIVTVMHPVIVGFPNDSRPTRVVVPIDTASAKTRITTQNSRKRGSGS